MLRLPLREELSIVQCCVNLASLTRVVCVRFRACIQIEYSATSARASIKSGCRCTSRTLTLSQKVVSLHHSLHGITRRSTVRVRAGCADVFVVDAQH